MSVDASRAIYEEAGIGPEDFSLRETDLDEALDLFAVCRRA